MHIQSKNYLLNLWYSIFQRLQCGISLINVSCFSKNMKRKERVQYQAQFIKKIFLVIYFMLYTLIDIQIMIKEQNYIKIAEYTKKAFQLYCKRRLASEILEILGRPKVKKDFIATESELGIQNESVVDSQIDKKAEQNEGKMGSMRFTKQTAYLKQNLTETYITHICYGNFVNFQIKNDREACRMTSVLDTVKLFHIGDLASNIVIEKKTCFQICSPYTNQNGKGEILTSQSMVCLKNVFNGLYMHFNDTLAFKKQFGYAVKFQPEIKKEAIVRLTSCKATDKAIRTDHQIKISSYFNKKLQLSVSQQSLGQLSEKSIIASYSGNQFRVIKSKNNDWKSPSYYYLHCPGINNNISAEQISFSSRVIRKEYRTLEIDNGGSSKNRIDFKSNPNFYQIGPQKQARQVHVNQANDSLFQVWQLQRNQSSDQGFFCRVRNVVTNQSLIPQSQQLSDLPGYSTRNSVLQVKKSQGNECSILNQDNSYLTAVYDNEKDKYSLCFDRDIQYSHLSKMGRNSIRQFQLIELPQYKCHILTHLVKAFYFLKYNYQFFQKWGWLYEERSQKVKYSVTDLKKGLKLIRSKVNEVEIIIESTKELMFTYENHRTMFQDMVQQIQILQLFIIYSKTINMKMGSISQRKNETYFIAHQEFRGINEKIFQILLLLVENNKKNSEIIIESSPFFNYLLSLYPDTVGALLQKSINNVCLLTNKTRKEEQFIQQWGNLIKSIESPQQLDIQRKFIDILSEVAVDPCDLGITPYQNKIRDQLFVRTKKKIFPKFVINHQGVYETPFIFFQQLKFPLISNHSQRGEKKYYQLKQFKNYQGHLKYICSILRLLRNLCKDRNKKMPKIVEEYGLTQYFFNNIFKHTQIGWMLEIRFLDLYCSLYLIQDPFLPFEKREVKCFFSQKIKDLDFQTKTSLLFKQFTEQNATQEKHRQFDMYVIPFLERYFREASDSPIIDIGQHLAVLATILFYFANYGYLNQREIRRYVSCLIYQAKRIFEDEAYSKKSKNQLLKKILQLCELSEQVCTSIHGIKILKQIYFSLEQQKMITAEKIKRILKSALEDERKVHQFQNTRKRTSNVRRSDKYIGQRSYVSFQGQVKPLKLQQFGTELIITSSLWMNSECQRKIMSLLQLISQRGEHICGFLQEVLILNTEQQQSQYLQYSGITPSKIIYDKNSDSSNSPPNRLLNVMKIKDLVEKITEEEMNKGDEQNKNQKILELNNLLMKIIYNLEAHKRKNYRIFAKCQILLQKLHLHGIILEILKYQEEICYQDIINSIINFYCLFVESNDTNLCIMARYFKDLSKRYSFKKLPVLIAQLFSKTKNQEEAFWLVYSNIDKKMENEHKEILFQCIYNILKQCPLELFQKLKGTLLYSLTSYKQFRKIIRVEQNNKFPHFIKLLCLVGKGMPATYRMINQIISRSEIVQELKMPKHDYGVKWIYLRLYSFLFIQNGADFDESEREMLVQSIFIKQLRYFPPTLRDKAQKSTLQSKEGRRFSQTEKPDQKLIKSEFNKLMIQSNPNMPASMEQTYLMYLLNISDITQFSMLSCLLLVLQQYHISSAYTLATYLSQVINFMKKIYVKEEQSYQSKILAYLICIYETIHEKYNFYIQSENKLPFSEAYALVESFYLKLAQLLRMENSSFLSILIDTGVTYDELNQSRQNKSLKKLVRQGEFSALIYKLGANNNFIFLDRITEGSIKVFFEQVKEKETNKLNLFNFLTKLFEVLQNQKMCELEKKFNKRRNSQDFSGDASIKKEQVKYLNSQLITREIEEFKNVYNLRLKNLMVQKIKGDLLIAILNYEQHKSEKWQSQRISNFFELLIIGQNYPICSFTIEIILKRIKQQNILYLISQKLRDKYLQFMLKKLEYSCDGKMIGIIVEIYKHHGGNGDIALAIENTALKLCEGSIQQSGFDNNGNYYINYLDKFYDLFANFMIKGTLKNKLTKSIQKHISTLFVNYCHEFFRYQRIEASNFCVLLLQKMVDIFDNFEIIAQCLAKNTAFITENGQIIKKYLKNGIFCTNYKNQHYSMLVYKFCKLLIKMRARHISLPLVEITRQWPFESILSIFKKSYNSQLSHKIYQGQKCRRDQACSLQFCNQQLITPFDNTIVESISSMVTVIKIISELELSENSISRSQRQKVPNFFRDLRKGQSVELKKQYQQVLEIVQQIQVNINGNEKCNIYFSLPMMNKFRKPEFEEELNQQIQLFKKESFFQNLDHFSFLVEKELESHQQGKYGLLQRNYKTITSILQILFIIYLFLLCTFSLFLLDARPKPFMYAINSLILILKCCMFARDIRKFFIQKRALINISYEKNVMFAKLNWIVSSFLVIICYCFIYATEFIFPVVLLLQAYQIKAFSQLVVISFSAFKHSFVYLSIISVFFLSYSFVLFTQNYRNSIFEIFIELQKQLILYSSIAIDGDLPSIFPLLKFNPLLIPVFSLLTIIGQSILVSSLVYSLFKNSEKKTKNQKTCKICNCTKEQCEQKNVNFAQHIRKDHSPWTYIYFFIYMRKEEAKGEARGPLFTKIKQSIDIQHFEFLKTNLELIP